MNQKRLEKYILLISAVLLLWGIFFTPEQIILRSEEPRRAVIAMEMIFSGDYLKPQMHGWPYYNKPPIFNWILVVFMKIFGSFDEWVVRLPGQASLVATAFAVYALFKQSLGKYIALAAAFFLLTGGEVLFYGLTIAGQIDLFFMLIVFLHIGFLHRGIVSQNQWQWMLLSYLFLSIGVLTKGLPSVAFHVLTLAAWGIYYHSFRILWHWTHVFGAFVALCMIAGYFLLYHLDGGNAWTYIVNLFKEASSKSGLEASASKVFFNAVNFPFSFLKIMLPWSLLMVALWHRQCRTRFFRGSVDIQLILLFLALNVLPYWFAGHLSLRYLYPFLPFMAIVLAYLADEHGRCSGNIGFFHFFIFGLICLTPLGFTAMPIVLNEIDIDYYEAKLAFIWMLSIGLGLVWWRFKTLRIAASILLMAQLKLAANWVYYPIRYADEQHYSLEMEVNHFFELTDGAPVMLFGQPERLPRDASIGPLTLQEVVIMAPMPISYQHPYYIEKRQGEIMQFHSKMQPETYYLARESDVNEEAVEIFYGFIDDWQRRPLVLCKMR
ncbi:MAG: hypothetical protein HKN87_18895 [Saprospiraceae bacterium]|nr:hypothetical protein [Saprospiraceae bacterium]